MKQFLGFSPPHNYITAKVFFFLSDTQRDKSLPPHSLSFALLTLLFSQSSSGTQTRMELLSSGGEGTWGRRIEKSERDLLSQALGAS